MNEFYNKVKILDEYTGIEDTFIVSKKPQPHPPKLIKMNKVHDDTILSSIRMLLVRFPI